MTNTAKNQANQGVNSVLAGAVIGAGVVAAGTMILKDEKTQKNVKKVLHTVKDQAKEMMDSVMAQAHEQQGKVEEKVTEGKQHMTHAADSAKKTMQKHTDK